MSFKFESLLIWQKAMDLGEVVNSMTLKFPDREKFNLSSQMSRAADSVALNISEGSIGQSGPEYRKFMGYAIRSLAETVTCLYKADRRECITKSEFSAVYDASFNLMNMMTAFKNKIK
ncbi:four helix bundle protein [Roseivirga seohaensis]|uniref:Four helix bundle protein n=1 Tax=Roseivirga seohaensis TaxID=1914963 RepID=A0A150Y3X7_9BACT|nr:four helix bundle protein [Roseivirga seohaensis]KYG85648.1 four helix bundle protein [Roseivirga seohaensis]